MQEKMKKSCKSFLIVISICMLLIPFSIELSYSAGESPRSPGLVFGSVYYSNDSLAKIYEGTNWSCINITSYCIEEYESGIVDLAIDNSSVDKGAGYPDNLSDEFRFEPHWIDDDVGKEHIAIGENSINGTHYVFITNFSYTLAGGLWGITGLCNYTEWEPIPAPELHMYEGTWIKILIPKFKNPRKESYNNLTTNADNTVGFTVYRDGECIGNATHSNETHYFFKDENTTRKAHYYAVAPIAKGGYVTFGKSADVKMPVEVVLSAPNGGEDWSGNTSHAVSYTIHSGEQPCVVNLSYSVDGINWTWLNTTTLNELGTYTYNWNTPSINSKTVSIRVNVTDNKSVTDFDISDDNFTIDSSPPQIKASHPGEVAPLVTNFTIEFNEPVNTTSVEEAFSYSDGTTTWTCANGNVTWYKDEVMVFDPDVNFTEEMQYNCTISKLAKDDSDPGNHLPKNYTWSFVAKPGRGNFSVTVEYPPSSVYETDWCQIKVTVTNGAAPDAYNKSAPLLVEFFRSSVGMNFTKPFYTTTIGGMCPNGSGVAYANFTFPSHGTWYLKVRITVESPVDVINGGKSYENVSNAIEVKPGLRPAPKKEIGSGPYVLIALMVVIAIVVALWVIASYRKKIKNRSLKERKRKPRDLKELKKIEFEIGKK